MKAVILTSGVLVIALAGGVAYYNATQRSDTMQNTAVSGTSDLETTAAAETPPAASDFNPFAAINPVATDTASGSTQAVQQAQPDDSEKTVERIRDETPADQTSPAQDSATAVDISGNVGSLVWQRNEAVEGGSRYFRGASVVLSGPDDVTIEVSGSDASAVVVENNLADGVYKWQAVYQPEIDPYVREQMSAVRESGNDLEHRKMIRKFQKEGLYPTNKELAMNMASGSFRVLNGEIVNSQLTEE